MEPHDPFEIPAQHDVLPPDTGIETRQHVNGDPFQAPERLARSILPPAQVVALDGTADQHDRRAADEPRDDVGGNRRRAVSLNENRVVRLAESKKPPEGEERESEERRGAGLLCESRAGGLADRLAADDLPCHQRQLTPLGQTLHHTDVGAALDDEAKTQAGVARPLTSRAKVACSHVEVVQADIGVPAAASSSHEHTAATWRACCSTSSAFGGRRESAQRQAAEYRLSQACRGRRIAGRQSADSVMQPLWNRARAERRDGHSRRHRFEPRQAVRLGPHARHHQHCRFRKQARPIGGIDPASKLDADLGRLRLGREALACHTIRAVSRNDKPDGLSKPRLHCRQRLDQEAAALEPLDSPDEQEGRDTRTVGAFDALGRRDGRAIGRQGVRAMGRDAVAHVLAPHVLRHREDVAVRPNELELRRLAAVVPDERQRMEPSAPPRIEQCQAGRTEHAIARPRPRKSQGLPAADARAGVGVRDKDGWRDCKQPRLHRRIGDAVHKQHRRRPAPQPFERPFGIVKRRAPLARSLRQRDALALDWMILLGPQGYLTARRRDR